LLKFTSVLQYITPTEFADIGEFRAINITPPIGVKNDCVLFSKPRIYGAGLQIISPKVRERNITTLGIVEVTDFSL
jgi:hypothetical protein